MMQEIDLVFNGPREMDQQDLQKWITADSRQHLDTIISALEKQAEFTHDNCAAIAKEVAAQLGIKLVTLLQPIRLALLGKASGPGVFDLLTVIRKDETIERLRMFCDTL
jgi:glutamyl-tRNA synthetase